MISSSMIMIVIMIAIIITIIVIITVSIMFTTILHHMVGSVMRSLCGRCAHSLDSPKLPPLDNKMVLILYVPRPLDNQMVLIPYVPRPLDNKMVFIGGGLRLPGPGRLLLVTIVRKVIIAAQNQARMNYVMNMVNLK